MGFQIRALSPDPFRDLFALGDEALAARNARRMTVQSNPGYPCRVSLEDAEIGETVILLNFEHQPTPSPYRSAHAIYVREGAAQAFPAENSVPELFRHRLMSVRAFDADHMMIAADVVEGTKLEEAIGAMFADERAAYIDLHNARPGCFAARVTKV